MEAKISSFVGFLGLFAQLDMYAPLGPIAPVIHPHERPLESSETLQKSSEEHAGSVFLFSYIALFAGVSLLYPLICVLSINIQTPHSLLDVCCDRVCCQSPCHVQVSGREEMGEKGELASPTFLQVMLKCSDLKQN